MCQDMMRAEVWLQESLDGQMGIEALARRMGYSSSQIRRRFRHCFGLSPGAYRDRLRLEKAARLLIHTPMDVNRIAGACGYRNHSAFSRAFQRRFGRTPRQYRRSLRVNLARRRKAATPFAYQVRELPRRKAILTRLYRPDQPLEDLHDWQRHVQGAEVLPAHLAAAPPIAIYHDQPLEGALPRLDLGVEIDIAANLALPPSFRTQELPAQAYACVPLIHPGQLDEAMLFMSARAVSGDGEPLSGEPPQLLQQAETLELRIPLL